MIETKYIPEGWNSSIDEFDNFSIKQALENRKNTSRFC